MQSRYEDAIADFQTALKLDSDLKVTRMNIRLAQAWLGRYVEAIAGVSKKDLPMEQSVVNSQQHLAHQEGPLFCTELRPRASSASVSARRRIVGPGRPPTTSATTEVSASPVVTEPRPLSADVCAAARVVQIDAFFEGHRIGPGENGEDGRRQHEHHGNSHLELFARGFTR